MWIVLVVINLGESEGNCDSIKRCLCIFILATFDILCSVVQMSIAPLAAHYHSMCYLLCFEARHLRAEIEIDCTKTVGNRKYIALIVGQLCDHFVWDTKQTMINVVARK